MNKTVLVTGASSGIGKKVAIAFAKEGYDVFVTYMHNEAGIKETLNEISKYNVYCKEICIDHSIFDNNKKVMKIIHSSDRTLDVLVNNAGISIFELANDITKESWDNIWNNNVTSIVSMCKYALPDFINKKSGQIINISSVWGNCGASMETAYSATKGAINTYTKALAKELAPSNISVNALACGLIDTRMNAHLSSDDLDAVIEEIPAGRIGTTDDVAAAAIALTKATPYLTGQIINIDGGWI